MEWKVARKTNEIIIKSISRKIIILNKETDERNDINLWSSSQLPSKVQSVICEWQQAVLGGFAGETSDKSFHAIEF